MAEIISNLVGLLPGAVADVVGGIANDAGEAADVNEIADVNETPVEWPETAVDGPNVSPEDGINDVAEYNTEFAADEDKKKTTKIPKK